MSWPAMRSHTTRFTQSTAKKMAPNAPNSPSLITSSVEKTSWKSTEENQRLSV